MLVLQDLPLTGTYAYHARGEDVRFFESSAREQQAEMVEMLYNRPSVALWIAHDDPPWLSTNADLGDVHAVRQNHSIDHDLKASFDRLDPSRPALAASGDIDLHLMLGWSSGSWHDLAQVEPLMVTAFGAQSLPAADSPAWNGIEPRWPVADDEPSWRYAGFQPVNWAERGAGLPSAHQSLESYVDASQAYQADVVRFAAEHMRTRKSRRAGAPSRSTWSIRFPASASAWSTAPAAQSPRSKPWRERSSPRGSSSSRSRSSPTGRSGSCRNRTCRLEPAS